MEDFITIQGLRYDLESLEKDIWHQLLNATRKKNDPFRAPALATQAAYGIGLRTVILREVQTLQHQLIFHSDLRAAKIDEIRSEKQVSLLFYHPSKNIQLRLGGVATIHAEGDLADEQWAKTSIGSLKIYSTPLAPARELSSPTAAHDQSQTNLTREDIELGRKNFAVILFKTEFMDWLWLDPTGHKRSQFVYDHDVISRKWVSP